MNQIKNIIRGLVFLNLLVLIGCDREEAIDTEEILSGEESFSFDMNDTQLITFHHEGMEIINSDSTDALSSGYPFPFEPYQLYDEYEMTRREDTLRIESEGETYELTILGPRLFLDEESGLELNTEEYLFDEFD